MLDKEDGDVTISTAWTPATDRGMWRRPSRALRQIGLVVALCKQYLTHSSFSYTSQTHRRLTNSKFHYKEICEQKQFVCSLLKPTDAN